MRATCPNDPSHKRFITVVHITEEWEVNELGGFVEIANKEDGELLVGPDRGNTWTCKECGAEANVTDSSADVADHRNRR